MSMIVGFVAVAAAHSSHSSESYRPHEPVDVLTELKQFHVTNPAVVFGKPEGSAHHSRMLNADGEKLAMHAPKLSLEVEIFDTTYTLELTQSADLLGAGFTVTTHYDDGSVSDTEVENCYYHGHVAGVPDSTVTGSTCHGFDALLTMNGERYVIMPAENDAKLAATLDHKAPVDSTGAVLDHHVIFKVSDMKQQPAFGCSSAVPHPEPEEGKQVKVLETHEAGQRRLLACDTTWAKWSPPGTGDCACKSPSWTLTGTTQSYCGVCGNPDGDANAWCFTQGTCVGTNWAYCGKPVATSPTVAPQSPTPRPPEAATTSGVANVGSSFMELVVVNDASQVTKSGTAEQASLNAIKVVNEVKAIYQKLGLGINIILVNVINLQGAATANAGISTSASDSINTVLDQTTAYFRANRATGKDNLHLITGIDRSGGTTGLAWVGTMCGSQSTGVSENNGLWQFLAETVAHEIGHNWGAEHDSKGNSCDGSANIMAASHTVSNTFTRAFKSFSTCSKSYVQSKLQSLLNTPSNCLTNDPGVAFGATAQCGDGIKSTGEACDNGSKNGPTGTCSSTCKLNAGVQCTSGPCCTSVGKFKPSGTVCRSAMHQCDMVDYCSGSSASCSTDRFKPDNTACTEAGPGSKCYQGSCKGLNGQCANAFTGYTGTWVQTISTGSCSCSCNANDVCGGLRCANLDSAGSCKTYNCASGYTCTIDGKQLKGPATYQYCSCANAPSSNGAMVKIQDGTPCGTSKTCKAGTCTPIPAGAEITCTSDCGTNGKCGQLLDGSYTCVCNPGWTGDACVTAVPCGTAACPAKNRQSCVADNKCGPCLKAFASSVFDDDAGNSTCDLQKSTVPTVYSETTEGVDTSADLMDGDMYTHFTDSFRASESVSVVFLLDTPSAVSRYDITSSNSLPSEDPANWTLYGSTDCVDWTPIHSQAGFKFVERHETVSFLVKNKAYAAFKLDITAVADPSFQSTTQVAVTETTDTAGTNVTINTATTVTEATEKIFKVQVAEFVLYHNGAASTGTPIKTKAECQAGITTAPPSTLSTMAGAQASGAVHLTLTAIPLALLFSLA